MYWLERISKIKKQFPDYQPLTLHFLLWAPINKKERAQRKEELMD